MGKNSKIKFRNLSRGGRKIMVKRIPLNKTEKTILAFLYKKDMPMTANAIAKGTGISYVTVRKYIAKLIIDDVLIESWVKKQKRDYKAKNRYEKYLEAAKKGKRRESLRFLINPKVFKK